VTSWDDQSGNGYDATTMSLAGPRLDSALVDGASRPVLRFDGSNFLTSAPHVPSAGTLVIVFGNTDHVRDSRVIGWDDSATGFDGLAVIPDIGGGNMDLLAVRNSGVVGDINGGRAVGEIEVDTASWGADGVTFERRFASGETIAFANAAVRAVSDGGFVLHIGAPGDFGRSSSTPLSGDLAALRIYDHQLGRAEREAVASQLFEDP
jgi:hypothetical protein